MGKGGGGGGLNFGEYFLRMDGDATHKSLLDITFFEFCTTKGCRLKAKWR